MSPELAIMRSLSGFDWFLFDGLMSHSVRPGLSGFCIISCHGVGITWPVSGHTPDCQVAAAGCNQRGFECTVRL